MIFEGCDVRTQKVITVMFNVLCRCALKKYCNLREIPISTRCLCVRACLRSEYLITFLTFRRGCGGDDDERIFAHVCVYE